MTIIYNGIKAKVKSKRFIASSEGKNLYQLCLGVTTTNNWVITRYKYAFLNAKGELDFSGLFDYATPFKNGLSVVCNRGKIGIISKQGNEVLPVAYHHITALTPEQYILARDKGSYHNGHDATLDNIKDAKNLTIPSNGQLYVCLKGAWKQVSVAHAMNFSADAQK